mgnify:CR=1 FL=1
MTTTKSIVHPTAKSDKFDLNAELILNGLNAAILVVDQDQYVVKLNAAAEHFLSTSAANIISRPLGKFIPVDSPVFMLIDQAQKDKQAFSRYNLNLDTPRISRHSVDIHAAPITERPGLVILSFSSRSIAEKIDRQLSHRNAARSVNAIASILAHEVKNPLSGIRGAAQLLESQASKADQKLTSLIQNEVDRICELIDGMSVFAGEAQFKREAVNIHQILDHVLQISKSGFGRNSRFVMQFDPSLPAVRGDKNQLIQVFLNLAKNAVEAAQGSADIIMTTAYERGVKFSARHDNEHVHLPIVIAITDNGDGIPKELMPNLFDPFVTSKANGSGLGLALVAKIIDDHGGLVECDSVDSRTTFRVMMPAFK